MRTLDKLLLAAALMHFVPGCGCHTFLDRVDVPLQDSLLRFIDEYPLASRSLSDLRTARYEELPEGLAGLCIEYTDGSTDILISPDMVGVELEWTVWHEACHCLMYQGHSSDPDNLMFTTVPRVKKLISSWSNIQKTCVQ